MSTRPGPGPRSEALERLPGGFDLQSHRGGRGETTEESLRAFDKSLSLGVTTLELDVVLSADGVPMVWHDPTVQKDKCRDTGPLTPEDPSYPYVGRPLYELSASQLHTVACDLTLPAFPDAERVADNRMARLDDIFALAAARGADVYYNVETKREASHPDITAPADMFVSAILDAARSAGCLERLMIQSFDWSTLPLVRAVEPDIPLVLLWDDTTWSPGSPYTGPIDYDAVGSDILTAAHLLGVEVLSPGYSVPYGTHRGAPDYNPVATPEWVAEAHEAGFRVVPWTVNDEATMHDQIDAGVDGLISDYPSRLRALLDARGVAVPAPAPLA